MATFTSRFPTLQALLCRILPVSSPVGLYRRSNCHRVCLATTASVDNHRLLRLHPGRFSVRRGTTDSSVLSTTCSISSRHASAVKKQRVTNECRWRYPAPKVLSIGVFDDFFCGKLANRQNAKTTEFDMDIHRQRERLLSTICEIWKADLRINKI